MEESLKRGVSLQNRILDERLENKFKDALVWWTGGKFNKLTFVGLLIASLINLFLISGLFDKDLTPAFSSSAVFMLFANLFKTMNILSTQQFFLIISFISLLISPITVYLFVRRMVHRHELTAFLAALLFIIPSPLTPHASPLINALLQGDGAHVIIFSFLPLFLLYFKEFIGNGILLWAILSALGTGLIAISSPFAFFNICIFYTILTFGEGFKGQFRVKIARLLFILIMSIGLSFFWYFPNIMTNPLMIERINYAMNFFYKIFPIFIPTVPVLGAVLFLIFDRRKRLNPLLIAISLNATYFILYSISASIMANGIFVPERYLPEIAFSQSFLAALVLGFVLDLARVRGINRFIRYSAFYKIILILVSLIITVALLYFFFSNLILIRDEIWSKNFIISNTSGIGYFGRKNIFSFSFLSIFSNLVSIVSLLLIVYILKYFPLGINSKSKNKIVE